MISRRVQIIATIAAFIAIPVLASILVVAPLAHQTAANRTARTAVEKVNRAQAVRNGELQSSDAQIAALQRRADALDAAVPAKPQIAALLAEIGSMSSTYHVSVVSFTSNGTGSASTGSAASGTPAASGATPAPTATTGAAATTGTTASAGTTATTAATAVPIEVQVTGGLDAVRDFAGALQRTTRVVDVTAVSITGDGTGAFTGDITGTAYVLPASAGG